VVSRKCSPEGSANPPGLLRVAQDDEFVCANVALKRLEGDCGLKSMQRRASWLAAGILAFTAIQASSQAPGSPTPGSPAQASGQSGLDEGIALLKQHQPQQALEAFKRVVSAEPENEAANLLAASAALATYQGETAVTFAEKAKQLAPEDWRVNTTLVAAYAIAGHKQQRDAERVLLRKLHEDPQAVEATKANGFLLEMFPVGSRRIDAIEYFRPLGKFHIYYRFVVRDSSGKRVWEFALQSDDLNQISWAKAHPQEAAAGKRQFSLQGEGGGQQADYRMFSGDADYDQVRAEVARIVQEQKGPFPGEVAK
jgi:tetratricopeptide (TPR) repeat protein